MIKFFIDQHGCAKNQVDGEILVSKLIDDGFELADNASDADFIIINSCGFIESAKKESLDALYNVKASYPDKKVILAGCLAERYAQVFKQDLPEADGIFGNGNLLKISDFVNSLLKKELRLFFSISNLKKIKLSAIHKIKTEIEIIKRETFAGDIFFFLII